MKAWVQSLALPYGDGWARVCYLNHSKLMGLGRDRSSPHAPMLPCQVDFLNI